MASTKEQKRAWYRKNAEAIKARRRARYVANREYEKAQHRDWNAKNKEHVRLYDEARYRADPEKATTMSLGYYRRNRDKCRRRHREWSEKNRHILGAKNTLRRGKILAATPKWADLNAIYEIYREAQMRSRRTGVKHHVDHIYPLQGKTATGLHVAWNLQILTATENIRKGNKCPL